MGYLADIRASAAVTDEGAWINSVGAGIPLSSLTGTIVTDETAKRLSAVWLCIKILSEGVAELPLKLYERQPNGDKAPAEDDPLYPLLHDQPNPEQSAFEWVEQMQSWAVMRKAAYSEITRIGSRVVSLAPRHPARVREEWIAGGLRRYQYLEDDGVTRRVILSDDMFRVPGTPVLDYARDSFAIAQSVQEYGAKTFTNGVRPSGLISTETTMSDTARGRFMSALKDQAAGTSNWGKVLFLPEKLHWQQLGMTNEQAEFIATSKFAIVDCARWFRIPPYMVAITEPGAMAHNSVEAQGLEFIIYTLMPWVRRWEGAIRKDLILDKRSFFAEFLFDMLARGTLQERYAAYAVGRQWGWLSVNDIRRLENMNSIPGGDSYTISLPTSPTRTEGAARKLLSLFIDDSAGRIARKEASAMHRLAEKSQNGEWEAGVRTFFDDHGAYVAETLHIDQGAALAYARKQRDALLADGPGILAEWAPRDLAALAWETLAA